MTGLKTLKDFKLYWEVNGKNNTITDLKQEAIKWIKILSLNLDIERLFEERQKAYSEESRALMDKEMWRRCKEADMMIIRKNAEKNEFLIDWIKEFFNITDEDLK